MVGKCFVYFWCLRYDKSIILSYYVMDIDFYFYVCYWVILLYLIKENKKDKNRKRKMRKNKKERVKSVVN